MSRIPDRGHFSPNMVNMTKIRNFKNTVGFGGSNRNEKSNSNIYHVILNFHLIHSKYELTENLICTFFLHRISIVCFLVRFEMILATSSIPKRNQNLKNDLDIVTYRCHTLIIRIYKPIRINPNNASEQQNNFYLWGIKIYFAFQSNDDN